MSGHEDDSYCDDPNNLAIVAVWELVALDARVGALIEEPVGAVFERVSGRKKFERVTDWEPPND